MHHADDCAFGVLQNASAGHGCLRDMPTGAPNRLSILCDERSYAVGSFASTKRHATGLGFTHCSASGVWHNLVAYNDARISLQRARAKSLFPASLFTRVFSSVLHAVPGELFGVLAQAKPTSTITFQFFGGSGGTVASDRWSRDTTKAYPFAFFPQKNGTLIEAKLHGWFVMPCFAAAKLAVEVFGIPRGNIFPAEVCFTAARRTFGPFWRLVLRNLSRSRTLL